MRNAFIRKLTEKAAEDKNIFLLTGDLGFSVFEDFMDKYPDRFFNMGVAEQNMIGFAAGLALSGKNVFAYSMVPFITMRCFEQIRNDICYQGVNVKLIGAGGGLSYGTAGYTHHSITDIAIMRSLPNMAVCCPGDPSEVTFLIEESVDYPDPVYIRLGKNNEPIIHKSLSSLKLGKAIVVSDGKDVTVIATGNMLQTAVKTAEILTHQNISVRLISMPTVKPLDYQAIDDSLKTKLIITIEEHSLVGGLGSAVSEILAENENKVKFKRFSLPDRFIRDVGSQEYLREKYGLTEKNIAAQAIGLLNK